MSVGRVCGGGASSVRRRRRAGARKDDTCPGRRERTRRAVVGGHGWGLGILCAGNGSHVLPACFGPRCATRGEARGRVGIGPSDKKRYKNANNKKKQVNEWCRNTRKIGIWIASRGGSDFSGWRAAPGFVYDFSPSPCAMCARRYSFIYKFDLIFLCRISDGLYLQRFCIWGLHLNNLLKSSKKISNNFAFKVCNLGNLAKMSSCGWLCKPDHASKVTREQSARAWRPSIFIFCQVQMSIPLEKAYFYLLHFVIKVCKQQQMPSQFDKAFRDALICCSLPTSKMIWQIEKKVISKCL